MSVAQHIELVAIELPPQSNREKSWIRYRSFIRSFTLYLQEDSITQTTPPPPPTTTMGEKLIFPHSLLAFRSRLKEKMKFGPIYKNIL